jgi:RPA family protein
MIRNNMKLRHIFTALAAAALTLVGCQEELKVLDEVQVSQSLVAIPVEGGSVEVTVNANDAWAIAGAPEWLTVSPASGEAGETVVTFSAEATDATREGVFYINVGEVQQVMNVLQMAEKVETPLSTCAEVNNGVDGKVYRVKGTCTSIANTQYGNWYLQDETGTVYVYGTLYNGATQQFTKLGLEVGDIVTVEGPRKNYNGTIELVDVTVLEIEKSLLKLEKIISTPLPLEGGVATALLTVKAGDFSVEIPEDAAWLTAGEPTKVGDLTCVELTAAPNEGGARTATVTFKTSVDGKDYIAPAEIAQDGAIKAVTVADFLAAEEGTALYELTGIVKNLANTTYGNFDLVDATGSVYVYGLTGNGAVGSNDKSFANLGINEGDVITIIGTRASYKETPQVGGTAYLKEHVVAASVATIAEFLAQPKGTWCKLTGTLANLKSDVYGNFDLVDETASVYVYGLTTSFVAKNDKSFANLGLKEGDVVTLVGKRDAYNDQDQVGGPAYYLSHVEGTTGDDNTGDDNTGDDNTGDDNTGSEVTGDYASNVALGTVASAYTDGVATVNGVENVATLKLGTSKLYGEGTITLPAGTTEVSYYAVAWKGNPTKLEFSVAGNVIATQEVAANDGASGQAPYTITVADTDKYTVTLAAALEAETVVTVKTVETGFRAILFGVQAK